MESQWLKFHLDVSLLTSTTVEDGDHDEISTMMKYRNLDLA